MHNPPVLRGIQICLWHLWLRLMSKWKTRVWNRKQEEHSSGLARSHVVGFCHLPRKFSERCLTKNTQTPQTHSAITFGRGQRRRVWTLLSAAAAKFGFCCFSNASFRLISSHPSRLFIREPAWHQVRWGDYVFFVTHIFSVAISSGFPQDTILPREI